MTSQDRDPIVNNPTRIHMRSWCVWLPLTLAVVSCSGPQPAMHTVRYDDPSQPILIATRGRAEADQLVAFFAATNPDIDAYYLGRLAQIYIEEAATEGINSDVAFCQMVHETNYLRFGGDVQSWQNNFCGLGATGGGVPGHSFPSTRLGVRAHIQHLKAYANTEPLRKRRVDPRFEKVVRGRSPFVQDLTGTWATDPQYGAKLKRKLQALEPYL